MFIVSVISDNELETISLQSEGEEYWQQDQILHQCFSLFEKNKQDQHIKGTVVFCAYSSPTIPILEIEDISLTLEAYLRTFTRDRTPNQGAFFMNGMHQSNMSNSSMGSAGDKTLEDSYNASITNTYKYGNFTSHILSHKLFARSY